LGIPNVTYTSLTGPDNIIFKKASKLMQFDIQIPTGYLGNIAVTITNGAWASGAAVVHFCSAAVVAKGQNVPCIDFTKDVTVTMGASKLIAG
jgi:hypothetical protein